MSSDRLQNILNNNTAGSSELVLLLNEYYKSVTKDVSEIRKSFLEVKKKLGHFSAINDYLNKLNNVLIKKRKNEIISFFNNYSISEDYKYEIIFNKLSSETKKINTIITLSRSGTLLKILKLWHTKNKKLKVIICESRPALEGRSFALDLLKSGIKVELITDSMMSLYVPKADAAVIGSDCVLKNGNIINKVGSVSLALLCKEYGKLFFIVTSKSKLSKKNKSKLKKENPSEVWNKKHKKLLVSNIYFEEVNKKLITKIFTE